MVKRLPTMWETQVQSLDQEDLLEKEMATHSSILAWKIPGTEEPGRCSPWGDKESDTTLRLHFHSYKKQCIMYIVVHQKIYSLGMGVWGVLSVKQRKGHSHGQIDYQHRNREFSRWSLRRHFGMYMTAADPENTGSCSWDLGRGIF